MSFTRAVPKNLSELQTYLEKIRDNRSHVKKVEVNLTTGHLEISLDTVAHWAGNSDGYLPLKRAKINDARTLVEHMVHEFDGGFFPSTAETQELYDMIDPSGQ
jgi:hypothetical protein